MAEQDNIKKAAGAAYDEATAGLEAAAQEGGILEAGETLDAAAADQTQFDAQMQDIMKTRNTAQKEYELALAQEQELLLQIARSPQLLMALDRSSYSNADLNSEIFNEEVISQMTPKDQEELVDRITLFNTMKMQHEQDKIEQARAQKQALVEEEAYGRERGKLRARSEFAPEYTDVLYPTKSRMDTKSQSEWLERATGVKAYAEDMAALPAEYDTYAEIFEDIPENEKAILDELYAVWDQEEGEGSQKHAKGREAMKAKLREIREALGDAKSISQGTQKILSDMEEVFDERYAARYKDTKGHTTPDQKRELALGWIMHATKPYLEKGKRRKLRATRSAVGGEE